jgi:hypothetical protein
MMQVRDFWPRYWGGAVLYDRGMEFFKALGGGKLLKDKFLSGFVFNPRAIANYKRAKAMGLEQNLKGEGEIKGGLFIVGSGKSGVAYQFIERNFGDWAPTAEIIEICTKLQVFLLASLALYIIDVISPSMYSLFNKVFFDLMQNPRQDQGESISASREHE